MKSKPSPKQKVRKVKAFALVGYLSDPRGLWQVLTSVQDEDCFVYATTSTRREAETLRVMQGMTHAKIIPCVISYLQ